MNTNGKYVKHGLTGTRVRMIWRHMMRRCYKPDTEGYEWYGGRGIKVCERWHDLRNFFVDMGHPPDGMSIDRIDTNGDYEPGNCRWATAKQQARNSRHNRYLEFRGERKLISDWCLEFGLNHATITMRLKAGLSAEEALTRPVGRWANAR